MSAPVWTSELGKSFWRNVRLGNIQCEFDERAPSGLWKAYEKEDGTLLTGSYYPRPSTKPLDCDLTKSGFIRLRFRVKGAPAGEDKPVNLKVPWDYIGHGQNRDSMLGKIGQPWVLEILNLLHRLRIPESERQSANVLKCEDAAKQALLLIQGVEDDWDDPTNQVHIIVKLHRVMTPQETLDGWECGNKYDWAFLRTRMYTKNWKNFPLPLAFNLKTLYTHMESDIVTRRSVLVTEAKGNGLHVGAFLNNRFCNTRRFPVNETIQIIFKVFKYVLKLQLDTLESEGAVLGDLHEQNITVMGGETREGPEGRVPGAEKLTFAVVDCSGTLPVINRPASELTRSKTLEGHLNCFLSFWAIPKYYPGLASGYACEVWKKMMSIGEAFNRGFREEKWRAPELMKNLLKECERLEQKFKDGQQLSEQCRLMKQEALQEASLRRPLPPADFLNYVPPTDIPPWDLPSAGKGRVPEPAEKGRVPEPVGKGKVPLHPQGTPPRNQPKQKARPKPAKPLPPPGPPPWARPLQPARAWQVLRRLPDDNPWEEDEPQARPVQPAGPLPDPWEQEWAPQPEPVQAAGPPPGRLLTPAEQFGMFPGHRQQARPAHPAQPPNVQEQPVQENRWGRNRVPEPAGPPPGRKAGPAAGHQEGRVPEPAGPPPGREAGRAAAGHQEGRVPEPAGPPPAKQPGKREPQALPLQPPAKKTASASTPAAEFRQTLQEYAKKNVEVPKVIPKIPPDRLVARNLVGKGGKGKLPAFPGLSGKAKAMAQKGQGLDPHLVGKGRPGEAHPATLS